MSGRIRGAFIGVDRANPVASAIVFQYNPDQITRRVTPKFAAPKDPNKIEMLRLTGPPDEQITFDLDINAADALAANQAMARRHGIHPQLAALEMLLYPKSKHIVMSALAIGTIDIIPHEAPLTFFTWGLKRVVPVKVNSFSIVESAFDAALNPISATVSVDLHVLSYAELPRWSAGYAVFLAHQVAKEALAVSSSANALGELSDGDIAIF